MIHRFIAVTTLGVVPTLAARAQTVQQTIAGGPGFHFGRAVHVAADLNNDGYPDVLVGAPGSNGGNGSVRCLSGKFLATSIGVSELWSLTPSVPTGAGFGASIIEVASLTGDIATDFIVGAPGYKAGLFPTGALILVDGATHTVAATMVGYPNTRAGASVAAVGDQDGDGKIDVATTAPPTNGGPGWVHVIFGSSFGTAGSIAASLHGSINANGAAEYGAVVASGFDLDHDGLPDLAVGSPDFLGKGVVDLYRADGGFHLLGGHVGQQAGERFGASIDGTRDFDGDGTVDIVIGSPDWDSSSATGLGRAAVLSGARLLTSTQPYELFSMGFSSSSLNNDNVHFGTSVRATTDLNGDGVPDVIVGAPGYVSTIPTTKFRGAASVFSGATGVRMVLAQGSNNERIGDVLGDGQLDLNSDGFPDFSVAGSNADTPTTDCGTVKFFALFPATSSIYCVGKMNSAGCTPAMVGSGLASASSPSAFTVSCVNLLNQRSGLFMYSHKPKTAPFQGGTLCVSAPIRRTPTANSGGSTTGTDCTGTLALDFNVRIQSGVDPTLVVGSQVFTQVWSRDPASASGSSLSNALHFLVNP